MEFKSSTSRPVVISLILGFMLLSAAVVFAAIWIEHSQEKDCPPAARISSTKPTQAPLPDIVDKTYKSGHGTYKYASVASELESCSKIGNTILARRRGNAVDATVATLFCNGLLHPQSSGIGGGSFFVIYIKEVNKWFAVDAREIAPASAHENMYTKEEDKEKSRTGGLAVGVPGELKGLYEIHNRFGSLDWKILVEPTLQLLKNGFKLNSHTQERVVKLKNKTGFEVYLENGQPKPVGSTIHDPVLYKTFKTIADDPMSFYNGSLAEHIVNDINDRGGNMTVEDLNSYNVSWKIPTRLKLPDMKVLYSMPPPGSGVIISYILSILAGYKMSPDSLATDDAKILTYHRIVEAMKFAYGKRSGLGDEHFVDVAELVANLTSPTYGEETRARINDTKTMKLEDYDSYFYSKTDHGTNHLSVLDGEGNAVAVTTTINLYFGSKVKGRRTGIVFNNQMDDFSTPGLVNAFGFQPSPSNFIEPGKRPQSSMSPSIVWDERKQKVVMVVGAAGGSRITTTTAKMVMDVLWFKKSMVEAMDFPRIHHQLLPNLLVMDKEFSSTLRAGLEAKGHKIVDGPVPSVAHGIYVNDDDLVEAACDFRKDGKPDGY